jgi:hypothetical protein
MPKIDGHLMVAPKSIISIEDREVGDHILCKPIETARSAAGLIIPNIELVSYDTLQKPVENIREFYTDKGIVQGKNDHFPAGTPLFWGDESNVRVGYNGCFLVRKRMVMASGEDAAKLIYIKKKVRKA